MRDLKGVQIPFNIYADAASKLLIRTQKKLGVRKKWNEHWTDT